MNFNIVSQHRDHYPGTPRNNAGCGTKKKKVEFWPISARHNFQRAGACLASFISRGRREIISRHKGIYLAPFSRPRGQIATSGFPNQARPMSLALARNYSSQCEALCPRKGLATTTLYPSPSLDKIRVFNSRFRSRINSRHPWRMLSALCLYFLNHWHPHPQLAKIILFSVKAHGYLSATLSLRNVACQPSQVQMYRARCFEQV